MAAAAFSRDVGQGDMRLRLLTLPSAPDGAFDVGVRISFYFAAVFLAYGIVVPYFPVWLDTRGLTPVAIATVMAAPLFVRVLFVPALGLLADRLGNYRAVIAALIGSALALALVLSRLESHWAIFAVGVVFLLSIGATLPLIETVAVAGVRTSGLDYGRMRLWGSITFIVANFAGGVLIEAFGGAAAIWMIAAGVVLTCYAAYMLPRPRPEAGEPRTRPTHWRLSFPVRLLGSRPFILFLVAIGCIHGAHATFYTFGALHWQAQGLSAVWVGTLWAIGVCAEVLLFAFSAPVVRRYGPGQLIAAGAAASVVRWTIMGFSPPLAVLVPLQVAHALTYGAAHLGAILFITRAVPQKGMGSAQALYAVVAAGLLLGLVGLASGPLYERFGAGAYFLPAVVALLGTAAALALLRAWHGGLLWPEGAAEPVSPTGRTATG